MKTLDHELYTAKDILTKYRYGVPVFQREYTWDSGNVEDLWKDLKEVSSSKGEFHYIGAIVVNLEDYGRTKIKEVVDGQQRLVTLTICFAVLRDLYRAIGRDQSAKNIQKGIISSGRSYRIMTGKELAEPFRKYIQSGSDSVVGTSNHHSPKSHKRVEENYLKFESLIKKYEKPWSKLSASDQRKRLEKVQNWLEGIRVLLVEVRRDVDAYTMFETLNARNEVLSQVDLTKNLVYKNLKGVMPESEIEEKWRSIEAQVSGGSVKNPTKIQQFFKHYWWSNHAPKISQQEIFKAIKEKYPSNEFESFFHNLVDEASIYRKIIYPEITDWQPLTRSHKKIVKSLNNIALMGNVVQVYTVILALARIYHRQDFEKLKTPLLTKAFDWLERFAFLYKMSDRSPSAIENLYTDCAAAITAATNSKAPDRSHKLAKALESMRDRLRNAAPKKDEFIDNFTTEIDYKEGGGNDFLLYVLEKLNYGSRLGQQLDESNIEHIFPRRPVGGFEKFGNELKQEVNNIGNLSVLEENLNVLAGRKLPVDKKPFYAQSHLKLSQDVFRDLDDDPEWTIERIAERRRLLANRAWLLWKIPS